MNIQMFQGSFLPARKHNICVIKNAQLMMFKGRITVVLKAYQIP